MLSVTRNDSIPSHGSKCPPAVMMLIKKKSIKIKNIRNLLLPVLWINDLAVFS
jgi:hypothetical protein